MQNVKTNCQREFGSFAGEEAFRIAEEERPGAVLLELPEDIAAEETDAKVLNPTERFYAIGCDEVLQLAAAKIKAAKRPLILVGQEPIVEI